MNLDGAFFLSSILLGVGLAMDAFSVSLANGLSAPCMRKGSMVLSAGVFAGFQFAMPIIGWFCVSTVAHLFEAFSRWIPLIALLLLCCIGGKMLYEGITCPQGECCPTGGGIPALLVQGIATSIDALSVGFTIADHTPAMAVLSCLLIGGVTFLICFAGLAIGKKAGTRLAGKAGILGGVILILIGLKIFFGF